MGELLEEIRLGTGRKAENVDESQEEPMDPVFYLRMGVCVHMCHAESERRKLRGKRCEQ